MDTDDFDIKEEYLDSDEDINEEVNLESTGEDLDEPNSNISTTERKRTRRGLSVNIYQCSFCGYQTPFRYILKRHYLGCQLNTGGINKIWECTKCKEVFTHHSYLRRHKLKTHKSQKFSCNNCLLETTDETDFNIHLVNNKCPKKKMYQCEKCPYKAHSRIRVINHEKTHNPNRQGVSKKCYTCTHCNRVLATQKLFKRHLMSHSSIRKNYCCEYCDYITEDSEDLDKHKMIHPNIQEMILVQCSRCDLKFFNLKELKEHHERDICTKRKSTAKSTSSSKVKKEKASEVSADSSLAFTCHLCTFATKRLQLLTRHCLTIHHVDIYKKQKLSALDQEKGYACTRCTFVTKYFSNLTRHIKLIHCLGNKGLPNLKPHPIDDDSNLSTNVLQYICEVCDIVIVDQYQLAYHKFDKHGDKSELLKWKLKCSMCKYKSSSKKMCFNHGKIHVKNASHSKVTFNQFYNGENRGTFFIDYIRNKVSIKNKVSMKRDDPIEELAQGDHIDGVRVDDEEEEDILEFKGKIDTVSFLEDKCVEDERETSKLHSILDWTVSDDDELDGGEAKDNFEDEVLTIEIVNDDDDDEDVLFEVDDDTGELIYTCEKCGAKLESPDELQTHAVVHSMEEDDSNFELTFYSLKTNEYAQNLEVSSESEPSDVEVVEPSAAARGRQTFKCTLCGEILTRKFLSSHTNQHAEDVEDSQFEVAYEEYKQNHFVYTYKVRANSLAGEKLFKLGLPTYKCNSCDITLHIKKSIKHHASIHAREENDPDFEVVFSEFRNDQLIGTIITKGQVSLLKSNPKTTGNNVAHLGYDPNKPVFSCDECNFKSNAKEELVKHKNLHWTKEKEQAYRANRWFSCSLCYFHCFDIETLKRHAGGHKK